MAVVEVMLSTGLARAGSVPTFGHAGSKWQLKAKPEQPQTFLPACLASGTSGFAGFGLFKNQPMLNCLNSPRVPTKAAVTSSVPGQTRLVARPRLSPWCGQRISVQAGLRPRLLPVPSCPGTGTGGSRGTESRSRARALPQVPNSSTEQELCNAQTPQPQLPSGHPRSPTAAPSLSTTG